MKKTMPLGGRFALAELPYAIDALAPAMSAETLTFHHGKHLKTYVDNLNAAIASTPMKGLALEDVVMQASGALLNNAGQVLNHNLFFAQLRSPQDSNAPTGRIARLINEQFGGFDNFRALFEKAATTLFGSGWAWLSISDSDIPTITQEPNASNPILHGLRPLLTADVWEHAYYVDYRNARADYLRALWTIIDWDVVNERLG